MRLCLATFDRVPAPKGASAHVLANVSALSRRHDVSLISLGDVAIPGLHHRPVQLTETGWLRRALEFQGRVARVVEAYDFDAFHVRSPFEGLAVPSNRPIVYEVNALYSVELLDHFPALLQQPGVLDRVRRLEACLFDRAARVVTPSAVTAAYVGSLGVEASRVVIVPNAPSVAERALHRPRVVGDDLRLVYAGSLAPWQGVSELLLALSAWPHFALTILTDTSRAEARRLERLARDLGLEGRVVLRGPVPVEALGRELAGHDVGVLPLAPRTRNLVQGCQPVKLLDYAAVGLPVLAPDLPVVREVLGDAYPLHAPHGFDAALDLLRSLAASVVRRTELSELGRSRVASSFEREATEARLLAVYEGLGR